MMANQDDLALLMTLEQGKPLAEAGKNSRTIAPIIALTRHVLNAADDMVVGDDDGGTGKPKSKSLLGGMSAMLSKRSKK
mgnify:CR=1 FL=1